MLGPHPPHPYVNASKVWEGGGCHVVIKDGAGLFGFNGPREASKGPLISAR